MLKLLLLAFGLSYTAISYAIGSIIVGAVVSAAFAATATGIAIAMAINMVVATIITKVFFSPNQGAGNGEYGSGDSPNPGNRQQIPPATDNKLPVVYGSAYVGGTITDLSISENNQQLYYVLSICEITSTNTGQTPDTITFGDIYYGGKKVIFQGNGYTVASLLDESNGEEDTSINGRMEIFLYSNGSYSQTNSPYNAIQVMQTAGLIYTWDDTKLMSNCAFAIIHLSYSQSAGITGIGNTKFQVTNSLTDTGEVFYDYLINTRYGCAILPTQINTSSLDALTAYSNELFTYTSYTGGTQTQPRFKFNGTIDTKRTVMQNLQDMSSCCDCLIKYTEITGLWGVVVQSPDYTVVMNINDSNMISAIQITPLDIAASYNIVEAKFPDNSNQDAFNSATFDLSAINPELLYPNEPVNKVSISLPLVNNSITAQYLAIRLLKSGREDLQLQVSVNFIGIQLDAGDVVTVTNANYGWVDKLFRINKVTQQFNDDGSIAVQLNMTEFNPAIYDDAPITQFTPAPNTGIGSPTSFGTIPTPVVTAQYPTNTNPFFVVSVTTATSGITQYAEVWYSAYNNPSETQMYFAGTSEIQSNGIPWSINTLLPPISLGNIPAGNWYLFTRMVNSISSSAFSPPSLLLRWRPATFQYTERYVVVAYADDIDGTGFSLSPTNKEYYGLLNQDNVSPSVTPSDYTWYLADPNFGTEVFLAYSNRTGRKFSFATGFADYAASTGAFVPTQAAIFDPSIWAALPDGINFIDLDVRTGQILTSGTTTTGTGEIAVLNNPDGKVVASLKQFLDFGGAYTTTASGAVLTVDIYGRVVGFEQPDGLLYSDQDFTATGGQTVFTITSRTSGDYIAGNCWVLINGAFQDPTTFTDTTTTVTLSTGVTAGDIVSVVSFTGNQLSPSGFYDAFTIDTITLTGVSSYDFTGSGITLNSGFEVLFLNGTIMPAQDYDIIGQILTNFPNLLTGELTIVQYTPNNLGTPVGNPVNLDTTTIIGQVSYSFVNNPLAFNLYQNGIALVQGTDFTDTSSGYTLINTPITIDLLTQQTFARTGSA
jgi:hypothetical protein